ncbi:O-methyltransferase [Mesoterricola sediminis]|uniref:Class I SAM-dependent methyltransferase n=1 Tax=Mesoterricola sediminis TaxID=2927980 RepID=A0AA48GYW3_9BACT|nr:class I SAM-dependent methyltransferase [Mesoterricola sediminis]BDU78809.1 hypothetical protein METESE_37670 [Mesoterricola sediminis]
MGTAAWSIILLLTLALGAASYTCWSYQRRLHLLHGKAMGWPLPSLRLEEFDELFKRDDLGPLPERCEVAFLGRGDGVPSGTTDLEAWVLAVLAKRALNLFEFGTCSGRTAYLWARNSPPEARIVTLTLAPDQRDDFRPEATDTAKARAVSLEESCFTRFRYTGTDVEAKVTQIFSDSKLFDETPFAGTMDLVFIDGSHAYSYCRSDTEKALRMLRPGGIILWHDYAATRGRASKGVFQYLNTLRHSLPVAHLRGTTLAVYRSPSA